MHHWRLWLVFLLVLIQATPVYPISDSARLVETTFSFVVASQPLNEEARVECPETVRHTAIRTYTGIDTANASAALDGILWRDLVVNGVPCLNSPAQEASTYFKDRPSSPPDTPAAQAEPFFLVGQDNAARRCGPFAAKFPARYSFTNDFPRFKQRFIDESIIPSNAELPDEVANPIRGDIYMLSRQFSPSSGTVQSQIVCTYLAATPTPTPEMTPSMTEDDGSVCFPACATVLDDKNRIVQMMHLRLGDRVQVSASGQTSPIISFSHHDHEIWTTVSTIHVSGPPGDLGSNRTILSASRSHLLRLPDGSMHPIGALRRGDSVLLSGGHIGRIERTSSKLAKGLYSPVTAHGDIVVNGIVATCYTTSLRAEVAHALLVPVRALFHTATRASFGRPEWCAVIDLFRKGFFS